MINLLYTVIILEATTTLLLSFKTPLRKLTVTQLDNIKRGRGPIVLKTLSATVLLVFTSSLYNVFILTRRRTGSGGGGVDGAAPPLQLNPADQLLFAKYLLESTLIGFILFLALMIDRLHHYMRELRLRRKAMETLKKTRIAEEVKAREMQVLTFKDMIKQMESELQNKVKETSSSEATVKALRKQSEGLLMEYDRLLAENQELRNQLKILDRRVSRSAVKKDS